MPKKYIEREAIKSKAYPFPCAIGVEYAIPLRAINEEPTADVAEVKHGKWKINSDGYYPYCSECNNEPENGKLTKYCPECGAKMDKE